MLCVRLYTMLYDVLYNMSMAMYVTGGGNGK